MKSKIFAAILLFGMGFCGVASSHVLVDQIEVPVTVICPVCNKPYIVDFPHICRPEN